MKIQKRQIVWVFFITMLLILSFGCNEKYSLTTLATNDVTDITEATAICGGNIASDGGTNITAHGICWNTKPNPTIENSKTNHLGNIYQFIDTLTDLIQGTIYYVRAYAVNKAGVAYGTEKTFKTNGILVTTVEPTDIFVHSAKSGGNIITDGIDEFIVTRGVCYSNNIPLPTKLNDTIAAGSGQGSFAVNLINLQESTAYYVRAYASTKTGTYYGDVKQFMTIDSPPPGSKVVKLTVLIEETNVGLDFCADVDNTPVWIENQPGKFTKVYTGTSWSERKYITEGTTINIYGDITGLDCNSIDQYIFEPGPVKALDVSGNTSIKRLNCSANDIQSLDVSKLSGLIYLDCSDNKLATLDVSENYKLMTFDCDNNALTSLNVNNNIELAWLSCSQNKLISLDLSKNLKLTTLNCNYNKLSTLDVSKNTLLQDLDCFYNQLTSLDISNNNQLMSIYCSGNQLTSLDLSKNNELDFLYCENNNIAGNNMTGMINSLPDRTGKNAGQFAVFDELNDDKNRCLASDVAIATSKNWVTLKYYKKDGYYYTFGEYSGW
jgi:hypothetical protein